MAALRVVLLSMLCLLPRLALAAGGSSYALMHENFTEFGADEGILGEGVSVSHMGGSVSGFTDVGVHQGTCVGYAWPGGAEGQFQRSELYSSWDDLVQLTGAPLDTPGTIRAIVNLASTHAIDGDVGPKGAGSTLDYQFRVYVDGSFTAMTYERFVFQGSDAPLDDDASWSGATFADGALAGDFEIPYGRTVKIQSLAEVWASENASVAITGEIGIRFEIPPGSALVSNTPGIVYQTSVPEPPAAALSLASVAALLALARRSDSSRLSP